ncbi:MAG: alpha/beta hydrolase [Alphaproteobacteria bacterium]
MMLRFIGIAITAYIGFVLLVIINQRSFMYHPNMAGQPDIRRVPWMNKAQAITEDGLKITAWFSPPKEDKPTVVFFHGNASNVEMTATYKGHVFAQAGYGVLAAAYRGYNENPGSPSETGIYKDARAQINWLINEQNIKPENIVLYGESIGSGPAVQMATEYDVKALILEVPFSSALDIAKSSFFYIPFLSKLMKDKYINNEKIGKTTAPALIGVGGGDSVVPMRFGQKLFEAANEPKKLKIYEQAGHENLYAYGFGDDMMKFIESLKDSSMEDLVKDNKAIEEQTPPAS